MKHHSVCFLVEDDIDDYEIFKIALHAVNEDIRLIRASDGIDALEQLGEHGFVPDIIFIDVNMPRMGGRECLVEIKKMPHLAHVPVVLYSTYYEDEEKEKLLHAGAAYFFAKPVFLNELIIVLREIFVKKHIGT